MSKKYDGRKSDVNKSYTFEEPVVQQTCVYSLTVIGFAINEKSQNTRNEATYILVITY